MPCLPVCLQIGRYYLDGANTTYNSYDRIRCTKSMVHPGWSAQHGRNDISLCFLASASRFEPVTLAAGEHESLQHYMVLFVHAAPLICGMLSACSCCTCMAEAS
eukprot:GHRQ01027416.1.p3 GENE.GHRQ01027416.1~~GHRQ01027416.1.p3  ORF type:complete len:104 (+),score=16.97 GHRQ01027416.1:277-588(+)